MLIEGILFTGALFGLNLFFVDGGVLPIAPSTISIGMATALFLFIVAIFLIQVDFVGMDERSLLHLKYRPGALTLGIIQVGFHGSFALVISVCALTVFIWTSSHTLKEQHLIFWFAGRIQSQTSITVMKISAVVQLSFGFVISVVIWIIFVNSRSVLGEVKGKRSHFSEFIELLLIFFVWAQYQLHEMSSKICESEDICTLNDAPVLSDQFGILQSAAIFTSSLLVLDLIAVKTASLYVENGHISWYITYVTTRVVMFSGLVVIYFMYVDLPIDVLKWVNYSLGIMLLISITIECVFLFFHKNINQDKNKDTSVKTHTALGNSFFDKPLLIGTQQKNPSKLFIKRDIGKINKKKNS